MAEFETILKSYLDIGITALLAILLLVALISIFAKVPKMVKEYQSEVNKTREEEKRERAARDKLNAEQMSVVVALQHQALEQQKVQSLVIERNNTIIQGCIDGYERLGVKMDMLTAQSRRTEAATTENRRIAQKAHEEAIKVNERLKRK